MQSNETYTRGEASPRAAVRVTPGGGLGAAVEVYGRSSPQPPGTDPWGGQRQAACTQASPGSRVRISVQLETFGRFLSGQFTRSSGEHLRLKQR